jgi:hypothetical protein
MSKIIDCKMLVREVSNSRCFYIDHGTYHEVLLDTLDISADREAMESNIAALIAERDGLQTRVKELLDSDSAAVDEFNAGYAAFMVGADLDETHQIYRHTHEVNYDQFDIGYAWAKFQKERSK